MDDCEFCHDRVQRLHLRRDWHLCDDCTDGWDYEQSLTTDERRADEQAAARYVDSTG